MGVSGKVGGYLLGAFKGKGSTTDEADDNANGTTNGTEKTETEKTELKTGTTETGTEKNGTNETAASWTERSHKTERSRRLQREGTTEDTTAESEGLSQLTQAASGGNPNKKFPININSSPPVPAKGTKYSITYYKISDAIQN
jgi:hypothetical protein